MRFGSVIACAAVVPLLVAATQPIRLQPSSRWVLDYAAQQALSLLQACKRADPGEGFTLASSVYQWLNQGNDARIELENGIRAAPASARGPVTCR